jgi:hypothetical protein
VLTPTLTPTAVVFQSVLDDAPVEGVTIAFAPDGGLRLTLTTGLPSGCYKAGEPTGYMEADTIVIEAQNLVAVGALCTDDYRTVETRLALGGPLVACATYNVIVNGERREVQAILPKLRCRTPKPVERRLADDETTVTEKEAVITGLAINRIRSNPSQWVAVVQWWYGACSIPNSHFVERERQRIKVTVTNLIYSRKGTACDSIGFVCEEIVPLGHAFEPNTTYTVTTTGVEEASFTTDGAAMGEQGNCRELVIDLGDAAVGGMEESRTGAADPILAFLEVQ